MKIESGKWKSIWNCIMTDYSDFEMRNMHYAQQLSIKNNLYGNKLRLLFTNRYGKEHIIYRSHVSIHGNEIEITHNGSKNLLLEPGQEFLCDEILLDVIPDDTIVVRYEIVEENCHICDMAMLPSVEQGTLDTKGEILQTGAPFSGLKGVYEVLPDNFSWIAGLCGIEVHTQKAVKTIAFFGDSLVRIPYWTLPLTISLYEEFKGGITTHNYGISGNRLLFNSLDKKKNSAGIHGDSGLLRFKQNLFAQDSPIYVFIQEGINDLYYPFESRKMNELVGKEQIVAGYQKLIELSLLNDTIPVLCTLLPNKGYRSWNGISEKSRQEINEWIRISDFLYLDFDRCLADEKNQIQMNPQFCMQDCLHISEEGGKVLVEYIKNTEVYRTICSQIGRSIQ